jgi:hypothetical protein
MQIIIQPIPYSTSEFEYNSSGNSIVYSLIQHLSKIFGDMASIDSSSLQSSSSFQASTAAAIMPPTYLYDRRRINGYQIEYLIGYYKIIIQMTIRKYLLYVILMHIQVN